MNKNLDEHGNNLLNPNVNIKTEDCMACKDVFKAFESLREMRDEVDTSVYSNPDMFIHCQNGHRIPDETIRRVLYNE